MFRRCVLIVVLVLVVLFVGCASVRSAKDDFDSCMGNPDCKARVMAVHDVAESAATPLVSSNNYLVEGVGMLATLLAGIIYGRKMRNKG